MSRVVLVVLALVLVGCQGVKIDVPGPSDTPPKDTLLQDARAAWDQGDMTTSEMLYRRVLNRAGLPMDNQLEAWERYIKSAVAIGNCQDALQALPGWRAVVPGGFDSEIWQDTYFDVIKCLGDPMVREMKYMEAFDDPMLPWRMHARAGSALAASYWSRGDVQSTLAILGSLESQATSAQHMGDLELFLLREVMLVESENLEALALLIPEDRVDVYPSNVIRLERLRRKAMMPGMRETVMLEVQSMQPLFHNPGVINEMLASLESTKVTAAQGVVLIVPLTGNYGTFGWKVAQGAAAAQLELAQAGINVGLELVNSEDPAWIQSLNALPPTYTVVGGPLRMEKFEELAMSGLPRNRAFFTFLRSLPQGMEGRAAWRFFPSREDQVESLLDLAMSQFGMSSFAVMYPDEPFGQGMADMFKQIASARGGAVLSSHSYPASDYSTWGEVASAVAGSGFQALFLPGDWQHTEMIVPYLLYYGARNKLIMGPALWGETLSHKNFIAEDDYTRTVFPGTWWPDNPSTAVQALYLRLEEANQGAPDFFSALGYDFVRFGLNLGELPPNFDAMAVTQRAMAAQAMEWAMAPMAWSPDGTARMKLFMLRPTEGGFTLVDPAELRKRLN